MLVDEHGVRLRKVDTIFLDGANNDVGERGPTENYDGAARSEPILTAYGREWPPP